MHKLVSMLRNCVCYHEGFLKTAKLLAVTLKRSQKIHCNGQLRRPQRVLTGPTTITSGLIYLTLWRMASLTQVSINHPTEQGPAVHQQLAAFLAFRLIQINPEITSLRMRSRQAWFGGHNDNSRHVTQAGFVHQPDINQSQKNIHGGV